VAGVGACGNLFCEAESAVRAPSGRAGVRCSQGGESNPSADPLHPRRPRPSRRLRQHRGTAANQTADGSDRDRGTASPASTRAPKVSGGCCQVHPVGLACGGTVNRKAWVAFVLVQLFGELGPWAGLHMKSALGPDLWFAGIIIMMPGRLLALWLEQVFWGV